MFSQKSHPNKQQQTTIPNPYRKAVQLWFYLANLGINDDLNKTRQKKTRILNGIYVLIIIINIILALRWLSIGYPQFIGINIIVYTIMAVSLLLNKLRFYILSKNISFILIPLLLTVTDIYLDIGAVYYLLPTLIVVAFHFEKKKVFYIYTLFLTVLYLLVESKILSVDTILLEPDNQIRAYLVNSVLVMVTSFVALLFFINQNKEDQAEILIKNAMLEESVKFAHEKAAFSSLLLKEMNHRVKNNLQLISSLLDIQAEKLPDDNTRKAIEDVRNRIFSIALIHKRLYSDPNVPMVEISTFVDDLIPHILDLKPFGEEKIDLIKKIDCPALKIEDAVSIGLILNELITNSIIHGLSKGENKRLEVILQQKAKTKLFISVADNGSGIIEFVNNDSESFGFELVETLVNDYDGSISIDENQNRISIVLVIEEEDQKL